MDPVMSSFGRKVAAVPLRTPVLPLVSGLSGGLTGAAAAKPDWWVRQLREPVRFADALTGLDRLGCTVWIELGPAPVLTRLAQEAGHRVRVAASLVPGRDDRRCLQEALAQVYVAGVPVDWLAVDRASRRRKVVLPTYPFQRDSYWLPPAAGTARSETGHRLLGRRLALAIEDTVYEARLAGRPLGWLQGPRAFAGLLEMAFAAARRRWPGQSVEVAALTILTAAPPDEDVLVQTVIDSRDRLSVSAQASDDRWIVLATASLAVIDTPHIGTSSLPFDLSHFGSGTGFVLHPERLSACLQLASEAMGGIPLFVDSAVLAAEGEPMRAGIELEGNTAVLVLADPGGRPIIALRTVPAAEPEKAALSVQP
jgi:acyl transferase domain-containing protein